VIKDDHRRACSERDPAGTHNAQHTVTFRYDQANKLVTMNARRGERPMNQIDTQKGGWQGLAPVAKWFVGYSMTTSAITGVLAIMAVTANGSFEPRALAVIVLGALSYFEYWCARLVWRDHNRLGAKIPFIISLISFGGLILILLVRTAMDLPLPTDFDRFEYIRTLVVGGLWLWLSYATMESLPPRNAVVSGQ
jgi:YD repeat-containing protein